MTSGHYWHTKVIQPWNSEYFHVLMEKIYKGHSFFSGGMALTHKKRLESDLLQKFYSCRSATSKTFFFHLAFAGGLHFSSEQSVAKIQFFSLANIKRPLKTAKLFISHFWSFYFLLDFGAFQENIMPVFHQDDFLLILAHFCSFGIKKIKPLTDIKCD